MLKIYVDTTENFKPWSGAVSTYETIAEEDKLDDLDFLLEELYPEGISEGQLNDILWFESDWVFAQLGIGNMVECGYCGEIYDEILNEACKLFHLNKENFEKIGETDY